MVKDEWILSEDSSGEMQVGDLDWSPQQRRWGKRRQAGQEGGPSALVDFQVRPGETFEGAMRRVHDAAKDRYEEEYVQREQRAFALAKEEREHELMSQYGRELRQGVDAGQQREQEWLKAQYDAELARDFDA